MYQNVSFTYHKISLRLHIDLQNDKQTYVGFVNKVRCSLLLTVRKAIGLKSLGARSTTRVMKDWSWPYDMVGTSWMHAGSGRTCKSWHAPQHCAEQLLQGIGRLLHLIHCLMNSNALKNAMPLRHMAAPLCP